MTATTPCYRHFRRAWMAACPECTAWHLADSLGRHADARAVLPVERAAGVGRRAAAGTGVPPVGLHRAA